MKKTVKKQNVKKAAPAKTAKNEKAETKPNATASGEVKPVAEKPANAKGEVKPAAEKTANTKKGEKFKPEKWFTKACILLACTSGGSAIEEQVNFQWSMERLYSRSRNLEQTFEMVLPTMQDSRGYKFLLSEILRQIRTLKLGGVNVENVVVAYQQKLSSNQDFALLFVRKLAGKGIRVHFVNDSVLPPHLQKLKAGLSEMQQGYQQALEMWFETVNR